MQRPSQKRAIAIAAAQQADRNRCLLIGAAMLLLPTLFLLLISP